VLRTQCEQLSEACRSLSPGIARRLDNPVRAESGQAIKLECVCWGFLRPSDTGIFAEH
jgi:hypothetical protein